MEIGFVGLGKMGLNMTRRLLAGGHRVVAWDLSADRVREAAGHGATPAASLADLVARLAAPRTVWVMLPAGEATDGAIRDLAGLLSAGDLAVDGGNTRFHDDRRRARELEPRGVLYADAGTSGGVWGLANGYCLMLGGPPEAVERLRPALDTLAPPEGWLHCGPAGAGHYAKMIHNGIEYGMMQAYAEGFELLRASDYPIDLQKLAAVWNRGSVVRSWLLELAERAFAKDPGLESVRGWVDDSGEGRWTVHEAVERGVPAEVLTLALMRRFRSRQEDAFTDRVLAALRAEFGGHAVRERAE